jgi:hypothetical protein
MIEEEFANVSEHPQEEAIKIFKKHFFFFEFD